MRAAQRRRSALAFVGIAASLVLAPGPCASTLPRDHTVEIAPGVFYPVVQLGACTTCAAGTACCGSNLTASFPVWADAQSPDAVVATSWRGCLWLTLGL